MDIEDIHEIQTQLASIQSTVSVVQNEVSWIKKRIDGNGEPGILRRLYCLEQAYNKAEGSQTSRKIAWDRILTVASLLIAGVAIFMK